MQVERCSAALLYPRETPDNVHAHTHCIYFSAYPLSGNVEVRLERHGCLEPLTILLNEVEVYSTHQTLVLIKNVSLRGREGKGERGGVRGGVRERERGKHDWHVYRYFTYRVHVYEPAHSVSGSKVALKAKLGINFITSLSSSMAGQH